MTRPQCSLDGCGRSHHGRGFCRPHYMRWRRHGDPRADVAVATRVRDGMTYWAARRQVLAVRGQASGQRCSGCGGPATVWSYDGTDPGERRAPGRARCYSLDPDRYRPCCRSCTRQTPRSTARATVLPQPDVERAARLYQAGASARGISALLGVPRSAVLRALRAHDVPLRPSRHRR